MDTQESLAAPAGAPQQQPTNPNAPTSNLAVAGLVLGICGLFFWLLTSIPGIICSAMALGRIGRSNGNLQGRGLAAAGLVLSIVFSVFGFISFGLTAAMLAGPLMNARGVTRHVASSNNMRQIGVACFQYESPSFYGKPPASLDDLFKANLLDNDAVITNPLTEKQDYIFLPYTDKAPSDQITLLEGPGSFSASITALYRDGHVTPLLIDGAKAQQEFADALRKKDAKVLKQFMDQYQLKFHIPGGKK